MKAVFSISALALALVLTAFSCGPSAEQKKAVADLEAAAKNFVEADKAASESLKGSIDGGNAALQKFEEEKMAKKMVSEAADKAAEALKAAIAEASAVAPANTAEATQWAEKYKKAPGKVEEMKKALETVQGQAAERTKMADDAAAKINNAKAELEKVVAEAAAAKPEAKGKKKK